jgi:hypothetical protein
MNYMFGSSFLILINKHTLFLIISIAILRNRLAGPQDHLCCWNRKALKVLGSSLFAYTYITLLFQKIKRKINKNDP